MTTTGFSPVSPEERKHGKSPHADALSIVSGGSKKGIGHGSFHAQAPVAGGSHKPRTAS